MAAFATGGGSQAKTVESIESILKAFNPKIIQPGVAVSSTISKADEQQAKALGEKLAKAAALKKSPTTKISQTIFFKISP